MIKSIVLFILIQLALLARYLIKGEFEPATYAMTYAFLFLPIVIYILGKRFAEKEQQYIPQNIDDWSFFSRQKVFLNEKPLYKGTVKRGYFQHYFEKKSHKLMNELVGDSFFLSFKMKIDEDEYDIKSYSEKLFSTQSYWHIFKNGTQIGKAKTVVDLKNTAKLTEVIEAQFGDITYTTAAPTVTSTIKLFEDNVQIGRSGRGDELSHLFKNIKVMQVQNDSPEQLITLMIHSLYFKNNS